MKKIMSRMDKLSRERTYLANERTFLSHVRTGFGAWILGFGLIKLFQSAVVYFGYLFIVIGLSCFVSAAMLYVKRVHRISEI